MSGFEDNGGLDDTGAWERFAESLASYLATMAAEDDHLIVETPDGDSEDGVTPYAQFCVASPGRIRAEVSSNAFLAEPFKLSDDQVELMVESIGWRLGDGPSDEQNFVYESSVDDTEGIAIRVREVLEDLFGIPHPTLMSARAWGPAAAGVETLGIPASADVATDIVDSNVPPSLEWGVIVPKDREHLLGLVRRFLTDYLGAEPVQDGDEDFVIPHEGLPVFVRVRPDQPVIDVFTRVVHGVRGRRQAAVEVAVLNRHHLLSKFVLNDREIYQVMNLPAMPFVPAHLRMVLPGFLELIDEVRSDLALRTGGRVS